MKTIMKAHKHLDQKAEALAQKHSHRLLQMRQRAMQHQRRSPWWLNPLAMMAVPAAAVAILVVSLWTPGVMLNEQQPAQPLAVKTPAGIPAWVADTQVPVEVLENIQFYEWLSHELKRKKHS